MSSNFYLIFFSNNKWDSIFLSLLSRIAFHEVGSLYETEYLVDFKEYFFIPVIKVRKSCRIFLVWLFNCFMKDFWNISHFDSVNEV